MAPALSEVDGAGARGQAGEAGVLAPFRHRNFALLWGPWPRLSSATACSWSPWCGGVYALSSGPGAMGSVGVAMTVPHVLFLLLGGVLSDRRSDAS